MNITINKLSTPNIRHKIQGIFLCEKLNKHLIQKNNIGTNFYGLYIFLRIIKYVYNHRLQQKTSEEIGGRITAII